MTSEGRGGGQRCHFAWAEGEDGVGGWELVPSGVRRMGLCLRQEEMGLWDEARKAKLGGLARERMREGTEAVAGEWGLRQERGPPRRRGKRTTEFPRGWGKGGTETDEALADLREDGHA